MSATVYLPRLEPGLPVTGNRVARHNLCFTDGDVDERVAHHLFGRGSPLIAAVLAARGRASLERTGSGVDRRFAWRLKRRYATPWWCPCYVAVGLVDGRRALCGPVGA